MGDEKFHCYVTSSTGNAEYFLYWLANTSLLGLTDFSGNVYELTLDRRARKKLLRNVAESLVENKWRKVFAEKALKVRTIDGNAAEISYIAESVRLPRVNPDRKGDALAGRARDAFLFKSALSEIHSLRERLKHKTQQSQANSPDSGVSPPKTQRLNPPSAQSNGRQTSARRRKRGDATGVVFSDDEG